MAEASSGGHDARASSSSSEDNPQDCVSLPDDASIGDIEKEGGDFCSTCHALRIKDLPADKREEETLHMAT